MERKSSFPSQRGADLVCPHANEDSNPPSLVGEDAQMAETVQEGSSVEGALKEVGGLVQASL